MFRYETMWETHDNFRDMLSAEWGASPPCTMVHELRNKLSDLAKDLGRWSRDTFGNVRKEIRQLKNMFKELKNDPLRTGPSLGELKLNEWLIEMYHREEIMWRQRARVEWLSAGDKNTKFFHLRASLRRKKNMIKALQNSLGVEITDPGELKALANGFYQSLYQFEGVQNMQAV